jgi:hypothetical protein
MHSRSHFRCSASVTTAAPRSDLGRNRSSKRNRAAFNVAANRFRFSAATDEQVPHHPALEPIHQLLKTADD